ncbi:MAG TPA: aldo/keto reductase [Thermoplasmata archaeon]|nr:aldo/keto reductase [Thermoplasmata archaeon]
MAPPSLRPLGSTSLKVAPFAFGGNVLGWTADERRSFELLDAFVSAGFNLIDTADVYSRWVAGHEGGESETILGRWLKESGRRKEVVIATKVGMEMAPDRKGLSRKHILASAQASLRRLGVDSIDLYQAHVDDPETPLAETLGAFQELLDAGTVHAIGASNYSAARLAEALDVSRTQGLAAFQTFQPRYNLMDRTEFEGAVETVCRTHGLGVITYSSLASGFLTGKYRSKNDLGKSPRGVRAETRLTERGTRILGALDAVAAEHGATPAAVALAWLMGRPSVTAPIASATSLGQLAELTSAVRLSLGPAALERLERASE